VNQFFDDLVKHLEHMVKEGFLKEAHLKSLIISHNIHELVAKIQAFNYTATPKWINLT
jgi:predicted Rossmann-fold nucleotide-binding protein